MPKVIVVADVEDGASVALQRRLEFFDAGQVEVVGGLIENEQLRLIAGAASYVQTVTKGGFEVYGSA